MRTTVLKLCTLHHRYYRHVTGIGNKGNQHLLQRRIRVFREIFSVKKNMATPGLCASMLWLQTTQRTEIGYSNKALQFYHRLDMHDLVFSCRCRSRYDSPMIDLVCTLVSKSCLYGPEGPTLQRGHYLNSHVLDLHFYVLTSFCTGQVTPIQSHKQYSAFTLYVKSSQKKLPTPQKRPLSQ